MTGEKISKRAANYRPAANMDKRCGNCTMFRRQLSTCTLVRPNSNERPYDYIYADYTCDHWEK